MPIDSAGRWCPKLSPKQIEVWNDTRRHILLSGARLTGKTLVAVHLAVKHAWMYNNDRVGVFTKSTKVGVSGVWGDLVEFAIPEWEEGMGAEGFRVVASGQYGDTRQRYIKITNQHGGESEITLNSMHVEDDASSKLKGTRWGMILWDEADIYESDDIFNVSVMQLRQIGLPFEKHKWVATANPAPEGNSHWLYSKFYKVPESGEADEQDRKSFGLHEFKLADNIFLRPEEIARLKETYRYDPDAYERMVEGKWTADVRKNIFAGAFLQNQHVKGSASDGTIILPTEPTVYVGWDMGSRNHAVVFMQHTVHNQGDYWSVLDELSYIDADVSVESVTYDVVAKMRQLDEMAGKKLIFKHWSDTSAFDYRSTIDAAEQALVLRYSRGEIKLLGAPKGPNSVAARIALTRQLFMQNRLYISVNCVDTIEMFKKLSKGKTKTEPIKRDKIGHIHRFDCLAYVLMGEHINELDQALRPQVRSKENFCL